MKIIVYQFFQPLLVAAVLVLPSQLFSQKNQTKELTQEVALQKGGTVRIESSSRKIEVKQWNQAKVKITTTIDLDSLNRGKAEEELLEDAGLSIKPFSNRVDIVSRPGALNKLNSVFLSPGARAYRLDSQTPVARELELHDLEKVVRDDREALIAPSVKSARTVTIWIPEGTKLDVETKYADLVIESGISEAKLEISNGTLDARDFAELTLIGKYCNANLGNVQKAEVEFQYGTLQAQQFGELDLDSKSSQIEYDKGDYLYLRSQADNINIEEIARVDGRKVYGSIRVDQLNKSFELEGHNVDIKFREITPEVELVKINNKYGDLRLPVRSLKNYAVTFNGYFSTVFAPFEKEVVKEKEPAPKTQSAEAGQTVLELKQSLVFDNMSTVGEPAPHSFKGSAGDTKGKHTKFVLVCNSCTVDFK